MTVPDLCYGVPNPKATSLGLLIFWEEAILDPIWPTLPVYKQQGQIRLISYRLLFAAMKSQWGLEDLNAIQWWHSGVQQKYHSGLPKWKRAFSLVRKWQGITSQEVPRADLQGNLISLTLTPMPGPKATTADENTETSLRSTSKSDWQKAAGRIPVCHFEPTKGNREDSIIKKHFYFPYKWCDSGDIRCLTEQLQYGKEQLMKSWQSWKELCRNSLKESFQRFLNSTSGEKQKAGRNSIIFVITRING